MAKTYQRRSFNPRFTIYNFGTVHSFDPARKVIDHRTNKEKTLLQIHWEKVQEAKNKKVFIVDESNRQVVLSDEGEVSVVYAR